MKHSPAASNAARQVELIIRRLNSLSTLPAVAANFLSELAKPNISQQSLAQIIEADPALTARVLALAKEQGIAAVSIAQAIQRLPESVVRDAILSVKVFQVFDADYDPDKTRVLPRKQLAVHALAVACCAKQIAETIKTEPAVDPQLAFSAGLLHDIGKLAIDEVMPKSFERVITEAKAAGASAADIERKYLGIDHCIVGKRLAEKWGLPQQIVLAIWLHHSDPDVISPDMPDVRAAQIVRLADAISRVCRIGDSGSYDEPECNPAMLEAIGLTQEQFENISGGLGEQVAQKTKFLALDSGGDPARWCQAIQATAATISQDNTKLLSENRRLQTVSGFAGFIADFLSGVSSSMPAIDIAALFASMLRRFYQTGPVCVYLPDNLRQGPADAVIINENQQNEFVLIKNPSDMPLIPQPIQNHYALLDAFEHVPWLFEQAAVPFDSAYTKIAPLIANGTAVGAVVIELRNAESDPLPNFAAAAGTAAIIIALAKATYEHEIVSERFAQTLGQLKQAQEQLAASQSLQAVAELAAGAAHELNNPLAVISGRAQLLSEVESDQNKKQMLRQIEDRAGDISGIIQDLLAFARPDQPDFGDYSVREIITDAIRQAEKKHNIAVLETQLDNLDGLSDVRVDGAQIAAAIVNVLSNSLESYTGNNGPIAISGNFLETADMVEIRIQDQGCGMDADTLRSAMLPFFSAKLAGRKRGMGLAQTQRLIELNKGSIRLESRPEVGTTVIITLPCKS